MVTTFVYPPHIVEGLAKGIFEQVYSNGVPISLVRWAAGTENAGNFAGHAIGVLTQNSSLLGSLASAPLAPFIAPLNLAASLGQMYQNHRGFQAVLKQIGAMQHTLGVLQATTAVIGVGVTATAVLSAVNLWQTLKLREDVKQLRLDVKDGFIDLKQALKNQGDEVIAHLDLVAQNITFNQHRLEFSKAYGRFLEATKLIKIAPALEDISARRAELTNARQTLNEALSIYNNPYLLSETSAPGKLRRFECSWVMEQTIALTYQLQDEHKALTEQLNHLQTKIRRDVLEVIESYETEEELDFLFPEVTRIYEHDLVALEIWKNQANWMSGLSPDEIQLLKSVETSESDLLIPNEQATLSSIEKPPEVIFYEDLKKKSHHLSFESQMRFMMKPELRREAEKYVSHHAQAAGYTILDTDNLELASHQAVANLYWYFHFKDPNQKEPT